jgi:hypothetical protein
MRIGTESADHAGADLAEARWQAVDYLALHEHVGHAIGNPEHAIGGDEGGNAGIGDERSVDKPATEADTECREDTHHRASAGDHRGGYAGCKPQHGTDRQIDAGRQHHEGESSGHDKQRHGLAQHVDDVAPREEVG